MCSELNNLSPLIKRYSVVSNDDKYRSGYAANLPNPLGTDVSSTFSFDWYLQWKVNKTLRPFVAFWFLNWVKTRQNVYVMSLCWSNQSISLVLRIERSLLSKNLIKSAKLCVRHHTTESCSLTTILHATVSDKSHSVVPLMIISSFRNLCFPHFHRGHLVSVFILNKSKHLISKETGNRSVNERKRTDKSCSDKECCINYWMLLHTESNSEVNRAVDMILPSASACITKKIPF